MLIIFWIAGLPKSPLMISRPFQNTLPNPFIYGKCIPSVYMQSCAPRKLVSRVSSPIQNPDESLVDEHIFFLCVWGLLSRLTKS